MANSIAFPSLRDALEYTDQRLIRNRHSYTISLWGAQTTARGLRTSRGVQIVDQHHVFGDGEFGLTLHLALDPTSGLADEYARFLASPLRNSFADASWQGIPCFAAKLGTDLDAAERFVYSILTSIYYNSDALDLECEVSDEGS